MKISERLALLKAGYTKDDINAMLEDDKKALEQEVEKPELPDDYATVLVGLANEVKNLKETVQASNRDNVDFIASNNKVDEAMSILEGLINPNANKEDKK